MHCQTVATLLGAVLGAAPLTDVAVEREYWDNSELRGELMRSLQDTRVLLEDGIAWPQILGTNLGTVQDRPGRSTVVDRDHGQWR